MVWDGVERRKSNGFCPEHSHLVQVMGEQTRATQEVDSSIKRLDKRINGTFDTIGSHIKDGNKVWVTIVGIVFTIVLQVFVFIYSYGRLSSVVEGNAKIIDRVIDDNWLHKKIEVKP